MECGRLLGGISIETLKHYDFSAPFYDLRYCETCGIIWKITMIGRQAPIKYDKIEGFVSFLYPDALICVNGRKIKRP
jgi:hypothetical protein